MNEMLKAKLKDIARLVAFENRIALPLLLSGAFAFPLCAYAQTFYGSIVGTVTDSTGAIVPGAAIVITNLGTGDKRTVVADKDGSYRVSNLQPGNYREDVELTGFKHFTRQPIVVEVDTTDKIDVPMYIGQTSETITVSAGTPLLQSDSASLGQVIEPKTVQEIPLNGRNVIDLIALAPGVVSQAGTAGSSAANGSTGLSNPQGYNNFQIGDGLPGESASFYDGAPVNGLGGNYVELIMSQDDVDEFRVATNSPSAEFGRFGGGVINYTTKTGSNQFHGTAYEYFRNKVLNAATYFGKATGQPKAAYNQNQFGGAIGGPIKKDKIFFFGNYEQYKIISGRTVTTTVPTAAERAGNFSADPTIYDPLTTTVVNGVVTRQAFTGNQILPSRFDFTANAIANVLQYYPLPNATLAGANYAATREPGSVSKQPTGRVDVNLSSKQHIFARYSYWNITDIPVNEFNNLTESAGTDQRTQDGVIGDTYSLSARTTLDVRASAMRGFQADANNNEGQNLSEFGPAWATLQSQVTFAELVEPQVSGLYPFTGTPNISRQYRDVAAIEPSVSTILGKHAIKFGADLRLSDFNYIQSTSASGQFTFNNSFTSANGTTSSPTGDAFASFLLGYAATGVITTSHAVGQFSRYQAYYANDTWQATPKLTVNMGLRWELPGAWMERHDLATTLQPNGTNSLGMINGLSLHGGLALVNSAASPGRGTETVKHDLFAPRLGVSYSPNPTLVLHAAYGITYLPFDVYEGAMPFLSPINSAVNNMVTSVNNAGLVPLNTLSSPFPAGGVAGSIQQSLIEPAGRNTTYLNSLNGLSISGPVPTTRYPYAQQWNASVQQELFGGALLQMAYAGARGTFLPLGSSVVAGSVNNLNQLPDQYDSLGTALTTATANPLAGLVNTAGALNGATVSAGQLLRPYPQYSNVIQTNAKGDNIYHSLQLSLQKRFAQGGLLSTNYTWAKNIGDVSGNLLIDGTTGNLQDFTNPRADRSVLNFDVRNRFVTSYVLPLPIGHGQRYLNHVSGITGGFVSGWEVNGITTLQSGFELSVASQNNALATSFGAGTIRPNVVPGCNPHLGGPAQARLGKWFNTACFVAPGNYSFGNEPRVDGALRASGVADYDLSLNKTTGITDRLHLQLRAEFFNLFNRVQFAAPASTLGTTTFGTVTSATNQPRQIQFSGRFLF